MAFIKIKEKKESDIIVNTDMICSIVKNERGDYFVYLGAGSFTCGKVEAKKIFDCIGVALD